MWFDWIRARIDHEPHVSYGCSIMLDMKKSSMRSGNSGSSSPTVVHPFNGKDKVIISHDNDNVKLNDKVLEGSAESIVLRQRESRRRKNAELIDSMKDEFPQLKNIYELLRKGR